MAQLRNRTLFFTTSPRTPSKMIPEIRLLCDRFSGCKWDRQTQALFTQTLAEASFFKGKGSADNQDFSARDRINRAPKALGFVDLKPCIQLTEAGRAFVYGKRPQDVFLRQLLKFQLPSPYHVEVRYNKGTYCIRPYLEILRLVRDFGSLSLDELMIVIFEFTDYRQYYAVVDEIHHFRHGKEINKGRYGKYFEEYLTDLISKVYSSEIQEGRTATRETSDSSLKSFIDTKRRNSRDYADACIRYLRYTGLIALSRGNRSISIYEDKTEEIDYILKTVTREPVFVTDSVAFKQYLFDPTVPSLYADVNPDFVRNRIISLGDYSIQDLAGMSADELKDLQDLLVAKRRDDYIEASVRQLRTYAYYTDIMDLYRDILSRSCYDAPLMLEYNTWRSMVMLDGGEIKGNLVFDDFAEPLSTAPGNKPDIECDYDDFDLCVEVTMQCGNRQFDMEGEPIPRQIGRMKEKSGKETYCLFLAPRISASTYAFFYGLNQIEILHYGGRTKILPLCLEQFMYMLQKAHDYSQVLTPADIRSFLDKALGGGNFHNEVEWTDWIDHCVRHWLESD